jgi:hypothetical protein
VLPFGNALPNECSAALEDKLLLESTEAFKHRGDFSMRRQPLILATLACAFFSTTLPAQEQAEAPQETSTVASVDPGRNSASSTYTAADAQPRPVRTRGPYFYSSARRHPLTPRDVSIRGAVESLGIDKHRFVRCELKDGSHVIGGITAINFAQFAISQGIMDGRQIQYSELKRPPESVPAVGKHLVNGLQWTGLVVLAVPAMFAMGLGCNFQCS